MIHKLTVTAAWACLGFIAFATLCSIGTRPEIVADGAYKPFLTVFERFAAYAVLGLLFSLAHPRNLLLVVVRVFGSAIALELVQILLPDRDARVLDAVEKMLGGAAGVAAGRVVASFFRWRITTD